MPMLYYIVFKIHNTKSSGVCVVGFFLSAVPGGFPEPLFPRWLLGKVCSQICSVYMLFPLLPSPNEDRPEKHTLFSADKP